MIADNLRRLRRQRALGVHDFAARTGVAASTVTRIEQGQAEPRPSTVRRFAEVLGVSPEVLTSESEDAADVLPDESTERREPGARSAQRVPDELRDLADAEDETSPFAPLRVHNALQQVAHQVIPAVRAAPSQAAERLPGLASAARTLSGPVAPPGEALGCFLDGLHDTLRAGNWSSLAENVRPSSRALIETLCQPAISSTPAIRSRKASHHALVDDLLPVWRPAFEDTCRSYAALLVTAAPPVFHEEVALFALDLARLRLDALRDRTARARQTEQVKAVQCAREATTALGSVLTSFDVANQAHPFRELRTEAAAARVLPTLA